MHLIKWWVRRKESPWYLVHHIDPNKRAVDRCADLLVYGPYSSQRKAVNAGMALLTSRRFIYERAAEVKGPWSLDGQTDFGDEPIMSIEHSYFTVVTVYERIYVRQIDPPP